MPDLDFVMDCELVLGLYLRIQVWNHSENFGRLALVLSPGGVKFSEPKLVSITSDGLNLKGTMKFNENLCFY